ncbi:MAG: methyltransferase domain-containing protein [Usitatibacter sp.]
MRAARRVEPEWLDELPAADPRAQRSRRDLVRINALMGNARIVAREIARHGAFDSVAEIGAGSGAFLARLACMLPARAVDAFLVDRQAIVAAPAREALASRGWKAQGVEADVFDWLERAPAVDVIVANLFLHHFEPPRLAAMLALAARRARLFVACEPERSAFALLGARLLGVVGCNDVSRHDAVVSVRAGFAGGEISALWPGGSAWTLREAHRAPFSHLFVASRPP